MSRRQSRSDTGKYVSKYRVTHRGWDFRDDFPEFILSISLYLGFAATVNRFLLLPRKKKADNIQDRRLQSTL